MRLLYLHLVLAFLLPLNVFSFDRDKRVMKDFMGINGHFKFKPELYSKLCRLVRNYHNLCWDLGKDTSADTQFPFAANRVNWQKMYSEWKKYSFEVDVCSIFVPIKQNDWKDPVKDSYKYGKALAGFLGPQGKKLCTSIEIGNEPGTTYDDEIYKKIFVNMAKGIRAADKKVKIVTCTAHSGKADKYSKSLEKSFTGLSKYYDVINVHQYASAEGWPTWRRSYPEDPDIVYLKVIKDTLKWRDKNAKGKEVWITEFGWDSCTPAAMKKRVKPFEKWIGVTDLQQAQYIIRSFMLFAELKVDRAYLYFYNDNDKASVHACSGVTRNFKPKISFWAMKQFYELLGDYYLSRVLCKKKNLYVYEFKNAKSSKKIVVAWSPTGSGKVTNQTIPGLSSLPTSIEEMAVSSSKPKKLKFTKKSKSSISVKISESPVYMFLNR